MKLILIKSFVRVFIKEIIPQESIINEGALDQMAVILNQKISLMPFLMKTALSFLTWIFDWIGFFYAGQRFSHQNFDGQKHMVKRGEKYFIAPFRELIKFYQKMSVFIYYSVLDQEP